MSDEPLVLDEHQRMTLQHYLKHVAKDSPERQLEALRMAFKVHHGLYTQEKDAEGAAIYKPLLDAAMKAKSVEELEALLQAKPDISPIVTDKMKTFEEFERWLVASRLKRMQKIKDRQAYQQEYLDKQQNPPPLDLSQHLRPDQLKKKPKA